MALGSSSFESFNDHSSVGERRELLVGTLKVAALLGVADCIERKSKSTQFHLGWQEAGQYVERRAEKAVNRFLSQGKS